MKYIYQCNNEKCENFEKEVEINKPIADSSKEEFCEKCKEEMSRVFKPFGLKTAGDGYKS